MQLNYRTYQQCWNIKVVQRDQIHATGFMRVFLFLTHYLFFNLLGIRLPVEKQEGASQARQNDV